MVCLCNKIISLLPKGKERRKFLQLPAMPQWDERRILIFMERHFQRIHTERKTENVMRNIYEAL